MALPAARAFHSILSDRLPFRRLVTVLVLARVAFLVLSGRISPDVARTSPDQDALDPERTLDSLPQQKSGAVLRTAGDGLVAVGLIGLVGVAGAATFVVPGVTEPVRRAVRVRQAPEEDHRLRLTPVDEPAHVSPAGEEAEARSVLPVIARVVEQAAQEAARAAAAARAADAVTTRYAAARSRALGPTTALWHAVALDRLAGAVGEVCETTVCGSLVRVSTEQIWPVVTRDVCPACATVAR